jgi:hypothetical protein
MSSPIALQELFKAGFEDFVVPSYEDAPFTTIQNRAKVTRSLKAIAGVERVMVRGINRLQNEFGPNGEQVWEADSKDSRIRFVGGWSNSSTANGSSAFITSGTSGEYVEVTFYGTGLNILEFNGTSRGFVASIDGGVEGSSILPDTSTVLNSRNYSPNVVYPVTSGLTLGWHTARIRRSTSGWSSAIYGFEILNQRTDLAVYSGAGISQGSFTGLSALSTSAFNEGVTGSKGARVVKYIEDGALKSAVQVVDATAKYLTNADHTNEEVVRRINFREFGANRADDFSTLSSTTGSARAFTLDDGTTTLVSSSAAVTSINSQDVLYTPVANGFITITFVGTGLDILSSTGLSNVDGFQVWIDGVNQGTLLVASSSTVVSRIVSGLPYGAHTVRFLRTSAVGNSNTIIDFIIYQPKKPSIPAGAFEVADYNVMGNYSPSTFGLETNSTGVLKKACIREMTFVGAGWAVAALAPANDWNGFGATTATLDNYAEYSFWGTGFDLRFYTSTTTSSNVEMRLNGTLLTATNFPTAVFSVAAPAGVSFTNTTGILDQSVTAGTQAGCLLSVSNLPLGRYTVRITNKASGQTMLFNSFDIHTPIHINHPSLKVGSQSLKSETKFSPEKVQSNAGPDLSKAKAWALFDAANQRVLASNNISAILRTTTGEFIVYFQKQFKNTYYSALGTTSLQGMVQMGNSEDATVFRRADSILVRTTTQSGGTTAAANPGNLSLAFFGELIDE